MNKYGRDRIGIVRKNIPPSKQNRPTNQKTKHRRVKKMINIEKTKQNFLTILSIYFILSTPVIIYYQVMGNLYQVHIPIIVLFIFWFNILFVFPFLYAKSK